MTGKKKQHAAVDAKKKHAEDSDDPAYGKKKGILRSLSFQFAPLYGRRYRVSGAPNPNYDSPPEGVVRTEVGPLKGVQLAGVLRKKCKHKNRLSKWRKRFFVLKECFLLYYMPHLQLKYAKKDHIDLHPRGIVPLIGCSIVSGGEHGRKYCLLVTHPQLKSAIVLSAKNAETQDHWLRALREATKITLRSTMVGETLMRELQSKEQQFDKERQKLTERFKSELDAREETEKKIHDLEGEKMGLLKEQERLARHAKKLNDELRNVKNDLKLAQEGKMTLEQEKMSLMAKTQHLVSNLESLNLEKSKIEEQMSQVLRDREIFLMENQSLSSTTSQLKNRLAEVESKTTCLASEKKRVEKMLKFNEHKTAELEQERQYFNKQTETLLSSLKEISQQKEMTEAELRDQMMARLGAEKQLQAAEKALEHLENALRLTGAQMTELQEHIMPDKCAEEARNEANKAAIMRNAIIARHSFRRAGTGTGGKARLRSSFKRCSSMKEGKRLDKNDNEVKKADAFVEV
ncbi:Protein F31D4.5 b [Aphelenchoides avenae]|nr:Protein F31D4.5 b [Aphelenchus avenae]